MADPLSIVGGLASGLQLVSMAAQALLATIKLMKDLKDVPPRLASLLSDVDNSISRLCYSCNVGSKLFQHLDPPQLERLSRSAGAVYPALQEIHGMLAPLITGSHGRGRPIRSLWKTLVSIKVERELSSKLERLNRLNLEVVRELGIVGLEAQITTQGLVIANNADSIQGFSNIEAKMDSLRDDFQKFTISVNRAHSVALEEPRYATAEKWTSPPPESLNGSIPMSRSSSTASYQTSVSASTFHSQGPSVDERLSQERSEQMRRYLAGRNGRSNTPGSQITSPVQPPNASLEFILFSLRTFYTRGNFDASAIIIRTQFWQDTDLAIYLMKISESKGRGATQSQTRGFRLLKKSTADALNTLNQGTASILIELLSTLSPVNTTTCAYVREGLLRYLSELAREQLPVDHPIALIVNKLKDDNGDKDISIRALGFVVERLNATLGPIHELTQLATKRLCALLRRTGDYSQALRVANNGVFAIRALLGPGSLQGRWLLRQLEHVYMDQEDWASALSVCFDIVGQQSLDVPNPDPLYHDECAVYTMEDIAKTCECAGNLEQAVAWLKQARISGGMVWGRADALAHIQDKLEELLGQMGRRDELEIWNRSLCDVANET